MPNEIADLQEAYELATKGDWRRSDSVIYGEFTSTRAVCDMSEIGEFDEQDERNADFIILSKKMMPALLNAVYALRAIREIVAIDGDCRHPMLARYGYLQVSDRYGYPVDEDVLLIVNEAIGRLENEPHPAGQDDQTQQMD